MSPLARQIVKQLLLPLGKRTIDDRCGLLRKMDEVHCFECTDVLPLALELQHKVREQGIDERSTFLPAPKTWIEYEHDPKEFGFPTAGKFRKGWLVIENAEQTEAEVFSAVELKGKGVLATPWNDEGRKLSLRYTPDPEIELVPDEESVAAEKGLIGEQLRQWNANWAGSEDPPAPVAALLGTARS